MGPRRGSGNGGVISTAEDSKSRAASRYRTVADSPVVSIRHGVVARDDEPEDDVEDDPREDGAEEGRDGHDDPDECRVDPEVPGEPAADPEKHLVLRRPGESLRG